MSDGRRNLSFSTLQHLQFIFKQNPRILCFIPEVAWMFHCSVRVTRLHVPQLALCGKRSELGVSLQIACIVICFTAG